MLDKKKLYNACFGCMRNDHVFYCRSKLIFQHNGLFVFCEIVTIIVTSALICKKTSLLYIDLT